MSGWTTSIPETVTIHVPFRIVKRGGRTEMQLPDGTTRPHRTDNALVKALARPFRWKRMLESGECATIAEPAGHERIAPSYMTRVFRLTLLASDIVGLILNGKQGGGGDVDSNAGAVLTMLEQFRCRMVIEKGLYSQTEREQVFLGTTTPGNLYAYRQTICGQPGRDCNGRLTRHVEDIGIGTLVVRFRHLAPIAIGSTLTFGTLGFWRL